MNKRSSDAALLSVRRVMRMVSMVSVTGAAHVANRMFYRPQPAPLLRREEAVMSMASVRHVVCCASAGEQSRTARERHVTVYEWGQHGPAVLLVHGWGARASRLGHLVAPLQQRGFRVIGFDAPAHGLSEGRTTWLPEWIATVNSVAASAGGVHGIVAHSFGALAVAHALARGLPASRAVLVSMPSRFRELVPYFARQLELAPAVSDRLLSLTARRFSAWGPDIDTIDRVFSPRYFCQGITLRPLIVHDVDDRQVPCAESEELAAAWPGAELYLTQGLGHQLILHDEAVLTAMLDHVGRGDELRLAE